MVPLLETPLLFDTHRLQFFDQPFLVAYNPRLDARVSREREREREGWKPGRERGYEALREMAEMEEPARVKQKISAGDGVVAAKLFLALVQVRRATYLRLGLYRARLPSTRRHLTARRKSC
jgi:hypothetical protein